MSEVDEKVGSRQAKGHPMAAKIEQGTDRIGAGPTEGTPVLRRKRFRQHQPAIKPVEQGQSAGDEEGDSQTYVPEQAAQSRTGDEPESEGCADQSEIRGALFRGTHVGNVGCGSGEVRAGYSGNHASDEKPGEIRSKGEHAIIDRGPKQGGENDWTPSEAIGQTAQQRGAEELHQRVECRKHSVDKRRRCDAPTLKTLHQLWQNRND